MTPPVPRICCLDLDTFFVSVERLLDPNLVGKPVVVGGKPGQRGVVTAASYEVRELGVRSGMSLTEASRLAPNAVFVSSGHTTYSEYAKQVREVAARFSPLVQIASIDEMFLDFRGCERMFRLPGDQGSDDTIHRVVRELTSTIQAELGLPSSAGIATNKVMAKVACVLAKPAGVLMVKAGEEGDVLAPLPVRRLPGIGPVAEQKLARQGIQTVGQVAMAPGHVLRRVFGAWAPTVRLNATGNGSDDVGRDRPAFREHDLAGDLLGSISNERTFRKDVGDVAVIESMLCSLCERVCWRARKRGVNARTVTLKLRFADFHTITRSRTVAPTCYERDLLPVVKGLYQSARVRPGVTKAASGSTGRRPNRIRLLGLALSNLGFHNEQLSLFATDDGLSDAVDSIRARFGYDAVRRAPSSTRAVGR